LGQKFDFFFEEEDSIEGMKKLIVEEVNLFRSEVRAAARSNQNRQCVLFSGFDPQIPGFAGFAYRRFLCFVCRRFFPPRIIQVDSPDTR
jgi:hypothetical protein